MTVRFRPISPGLLVAEITDRITGRPPGGRVRVLVDGAAPAGPERLADQVAAALRERGRPVLVVAAADFLRPASVRLERGRFDPDARYEDWLDTGGLRREVLDPLGPGGSGAALPSLWNADTDRASRAAPVPLAEDGVLLLVGELLLGRGLPAELSVHLALSPGALARRTDPAEHWALPAFARYEAEVDPLGTADIAVRSDDPARPALRVPPPAA